MSYKTDFPKHFDIFIDRMSYVHNEYVRLMSWRKPSIWMWKIMWQYFYSFMMRFIEECEHNNIDYREKSEVFSYFDWFSWESSVKSEWHNYSFWADKCDESWEIYISDKDKHICTYE